LAYWIAPAEPARQFFASTIAGLATRFDAPLFEPHLTVYASRKRDENPEEVLSGAIAGFEPFRLSVKDIQCLDEFAKTVFVQFDPTEALSRLSAALRQASRLHDEYHLKPHLSLIYKKMTRNARVDIATSIRLPFTEVLFDSAKVIVCPMSIRSRADVEAWRVVAAQSLTK
jgi:2'-5' RNA ligase